MVERLSRSLIGIAKIATMIRSDESLIKVCAQCMTPVAGRTDLSQFQVNRISDLRLLEAWPFEC